MLALGWDSTGSQQTTESVRIEELRNDQYRWSTPTQKLQARCLTSGLCVITYSDADHVLSLDLVRNQHLGLFVGGQERGMLWTAPVRVNSLDNIGEQRFERLGTLTHKPPVLCRRIAGTEFRSGTPQVLRFDQKHDPIRKQLLLISGGSEVPGVRILDRTAHVVRVTVQTRQVRRVEDGLLIFSEISRSKYSPGVLCDVPEIARGCEMAESSDASMRRAGLYRINRIGHRWYNSSMLGRSDVIRPLYVSTRVDLARVIPT